MGAIGQALQRAYAGLAKSGTKNSPKDEEVVIPVQVNGKVRDRLSVSAAITEDALRALALSSPRVAELLGGREPKKVIVVPGRLVNIVG